MHTKRITRRSTLRLLASVGAAGLLQPTFALSQAKTITLVAYGGVVKDTETEVYVKAYTEETGIKVDVIPAADNLIRLLEAMVKSGKPHWDVVPLAGANWVEAENLDLLEPLDYSIIDPDNLLPDFAKRKYTVLGGVSALVIAQRTDRLPAGKKIESWADFWDVETFPGVRSLRNRARGSLEFALLADGLAKDDLYKVLATSEGADRAFAKLDEIKPHIGVWWENGAHAVQIMSAGEADFGVMFRHRIPVVVQSGVPLEGVWAGGAIDVTGYGIPKGSANIKDAQEYLYRMHGRPDLALAYIKRLAAPGFLKGAYDSLPPEELNELPTTPQNLEQMYRTDQEFWSSATGLALEERWTQWLQT